MNTWMVRAGSGGVFFEIFKDRRMAGLGWRNVGDLSSFSTREKLAQAIRQGYPDYSSQAVSMNTGQLFRFANDIKIGDRVVTYDPGARVYLCGVVDGAYHYSPQEAEEELINQRPVKWLHETPRDKLSSAARNSLGSIATLFAISAEVAGELWGESRIERKPEAVADGPELAAETAASAQGKSRELIKDRIAALDWEEMQELVAGLLRAMGYKTTISPRGPDRGIDIMASPDRFGFEEPRIVVEVKHRKDQRMGASEVRSFLGGRHLKDKGLYVSTGGFSQEARYEAERASIPLTLMDFEMLVNAILEHYSAFDEETKRLLPLQLLYWPA